MTSDLAPEAALRLFGPAFKANPYPTYAHMRRHAPIYRRPVRGRDVAICFVTRYDDVAAMLRDTTRFVKNIRNTMTEAEKAASAPMPPLLRLVSNHMLNQDGQDHMRLRSLVNRAFTTPMVERLESRIRAVAHELLGRFASRLHSGATVDLISQFALPLPIIVIADLLGVPAADRTRFRRWSNALISPSADDERTRTKLEKSGPLIRDFVTYLEEIFRLRREKPAQDLISGLLAENAGPPARLAEEELYGMILLLVVVGHETTVNLIGNGLLALLQQPEHWRALRQTPALLPAAVEEILRYDCPVERAPMRYAAQDLEWSGVPIRRGDHVSLVLGSANRDEAHFERAGEFRLDRAENRHLAFGLGPHYCLGAPLARLEGRIALSVLLDEFPRLTLAVPSQDLRWRPHPIMRGLNRLPVRAG